MQGISCKNIFSKYIFPLSAHCLFCGVNLGLILAAVSDERSPLPNAN